MFIKFIYPLEILRVNKKAFSLVELIVSILLLSIIAMFLYSTTSSLQKRNKIFAQKEKLLEKDDKLLDLLYDDIFESNELNISTNEFTILSMHTKNTLYDIDYPYVTWLVYKNDNTLLRFESILPFSKMNIDNNYLYHISKVSKDCEVFKIYQSKKRDKILIDIKFKGKNHLIYELPKPLSIKVHKKKKRSKSPSKQKQIKLIKKPNH